MSTPNPNSHQLRQSCLLHHLLCCASRIQYEDQRCTWQGDLNHGSFFYDNGCGDEYIAAWEGERFFALFFAHESERSPYTEDDIDWDDDDLIYRRWVGEFPTEFESLFAAVCSRIETATSGIWGDGSSTNLALEKEGEHGHWMFERHALAPSEAVHGDDDPWTELHSISRAQGDVVLELLASADDIPVTLRADQRDRMQEVGFPDNEVPAGGVRGAAEMLRSAGYIWE